MASEKELGFSIKILGTDEEISKLGKVETQLKSLAMERSSLNKAVKEGSITEEEYGQQIADINLKTQSLRGSKRELERSIEVENELLSEQGGSYNQLSNELNNLRQQYRNLSEEERESAEGDELLQKIGSLDSELKDIDASMGQYQRNVGNYGSAFDAVGGELSKLSPMLGGIHSQFNQVNNILIIAKDSLFGQTVAQEGATAAANAGTTAQGAMGAATLLTTSATNAQSKALRLLRIALIGTGIGAFVVLVGSLIAALTSTQKGIDAVNSVLRPMSAFFQRIFGLIQEYGLRVFGRLKKAIDDPKQAIIDLANTIRDGIVNRVKAIPEIFESAFKLGANLFRAFGLKVKSIVADIPLIGKGIDAEKAVEDLNKVNKQIKQNAKDLGNAVIQAGTGIEDGTEKLENFFEKSKEFIDESIKAGSRLHELTVQIEEDENKMLVTRERLNALYQEQRLLAQDQNATDEERVTALKKAQAAQEELLKAEQALIDKKIERKELENSLNDTLRADDKELQQLIAERERAEAQAARRSSTLVSLRSGIIKRQRAQELKIIEDNNKAIRELAIQLVEAEVGAMSSGRDQKLEILKTERDDNLALLKQKMVDEKNLTGERLEQASQINSQINRLMELEHKSFTEKVQKLNQETSKEELAELQVVTDKKITSYNQIADYQALKVKERLANEVISERQAQTEILLIRAEAQKKELKAIKDHQEELVIQKKILLKQLQDLIELEQQAKDAQSNESIENLKSQVLAELKIIDENNENLKQKAQETQTEMAENAKALRDQGVSWVSELFGISDDSAAKVQVELNNLARTVYNSHFQLKEQELQKNLNRELKMIEAQQGKALKASEDRYKKEKRLLQQKLDDGEISQEQYNDQLANLDSKLSAEKERIDDQYAKKEEQLRKKAFEREKELSITRAYMDAALAIIKAFATMDPISATIYAAAIGVTTGVQISKIQSQEYALGGMLNGPSHANGGIPIEAEGGEAIINKRSMASNDVLSLTGTPYEIASAINSYKGYGKAFALGGQVPYPSPPIISGQTNRPLTASEMDQIATRIIDRVTEGVVSGVNDKRVILVQGDREDFDKDVQIVKEAQKWSN